MKRANQTIFFYLEVKYQYLPISEGKKININEHIVTNYIVTKVFILVSYNFPVLLFKETKMRTQENKRCLYCSNRYYF